MTKNKMQNDNGLNKIQPISTAMKIVPVMVRCRKLLKGC
jgi:hypothetical protein